jgi:hypothetical protein
MAIFFPESYIKKCLTFGHMYGMGIGGYGKMIKKPVKDMFHSPLSSTTLHSKIYLYIISKIFLSYNTIKSYSKQP